MLDYAERKKRTEGELWDLQKVHEERMERCGLEKLAGRINKYQDTGRGSYLPGRNQLVDKLIEPLSQMLNEYVQTANRQTDPRHYLIQLPVKNLATLTLRVIFDLSCKARLTHNALVQRLGSVVEAECASKWYHKENPDYYAEIKRKFQRVNLTPERHTKKIKEHFKSKNYQYGYWGKANTIKCGMVLAEMLKRLEIIVVHAVRTRANRQQNIVHLAPHILKYISKRQGDEHLIQPNLQPMVVPPQPWVTGLEGGYHFSVFNPMAIISGSRKDQMEHFAENAGSAVFKSVNAIQSTPWRVNTRLLEAQAACWDLGGHGELMANKDDLPLPDKPIAGDEPETIKQYRLAAHLIHKENVKVRSKRLLTWFILDIAAKFHTYEQLWFPHRTCFRGRVYPMPSHLQPQGCDQAKALLEFANSKPLGITGLRWLGIHGANLYGNDKISLDDRYKWAKEELPALQALVDNPMEHLAYLESADKPWQYLAWAYEFVAALSSDHPENYESHLAVAMDGSCNGIQHLSALMLDKVGGASVNLIPSATPADIYQDVANQVTTMLEDTGSQRDKRWLDFGIDRKCTKRPVMVLPYGGTYHSCMEYTMEYTTDELVKRGQTSKSEFQLEKNPFRKEQARLARYIWNATQETLPKARECMEWLQDVARACNKEGESLFWTSPMGFPVWQSYRKLDNSRIHTYIYGKQQCFFSSVEGDHLHGRRQISAIAPNFIHSLDAACLMLTVVSLADQGIKDFHMVHDSYGCHACDTDLLNETLRGCFIAIHSQDPLKQFRDEIEQNTGIILPLLPIRGNLDISRVAESEFFFA